MGAGGEGTTGESGREGVGESLAMHWPLGVHVRTGVRAGVHLRDVRREVEKLRDLLFKLRAVARERPLLHLPRKRVHVRLQLRDW